MDIATLMTRFRDGEIDTNAAEDEVRQAMIASGATEKQASNAMYIAYERGHSGGREEVLSNALSLLSIWTNK